VKRLIICADGTWNLRDQPDQKTGKRRPTNVTKVARAILPRTSAGVDQVVFYHDGIGTRGPLDKLTGGAFGAGIEANIRNLYRNIVYNFEPGDELYFFGFSRGAFTVRSLAGFMHLVGLVQKDDDYYVPDIYDCYEKGERPGSEKWRKAFHNVKDTRPCPAIRFIGVWDTVGSLGAPGVIGKTMGLIRGGNKYAYHDVALNPTIENAFHALAIDERRKPFKPTLWSKTPSWNGTLEQAWFPGVHSNVGGSYTPDGLANEALHWMVGKAEALGLQFDSAFLKPFEPCFNSMRHDSMSLKYRIMGPHVRPIGREAHGNEVVHQCAMDRRGYYDGTTPRPEPWAEKKYAPENLEAYLQAASLPTFAQTTRVPRGQPC
jgi:uncharacterized protein (DUF2235 family)